VEWHKERKEVFLGLASGKEASNIFHVPIPRDKTKPQFVKSMRNTNEAIVLETVRFLPTAASSLNSAEAI